MICIFKRKTRNFVNKKSGTTIIAHPTNTDTMEALKAFMKALKIKFEIQAPPETTYNAEFVKTVLQGDKDIKEGKGKTISIDELNNLWK
jgi:hypothetical protein